MVPLKGTALLLQRFGVGGMQQLHDLLGMAGLWLEQRALASCSIMGPRQQEPFELATGVRDERTGAGLCCRCWGTIFMLLLSTAYQLLF
jgi:hypothetical protein